MNKIIFGDNLPILKNMESESIDLIYIDPPFNTGKTQSNTRIKVQKSNDGDRIGFQGNSYKTIAVETKQYMDSFGDEYIDGFLRPRLEEAFRLLSPRGTLYFHIDYREAHYCKIVLDNIFGRSSFINEIIWAYDFGGKAKSKWPTKHDNIFVYVKDPKNYVFNTHSIDREPYMAPGLVGPEKAQRGKLPTDTWWHTIVGTNSRERTGYPTQKPLGVINRIIQASSNLGDTVLDFFAGSGTVGESCIKFDREFILIDNNPAALEVMAKRFSGVANIEWIGFDPVPFSSVGNAHPIVTQPPANYDLLVSAASYLRNELEGEFGVWEDSPFQWTLVLPPAKKGKLGRNMIATWCAMKGFSVEKLGDPDASLLINGYRIATKFSTLWSGGLYKFQQVRDTGYDFVFCLGISPDQAHAWIFPREFALKNATIQHGGKKGTEYWITIKPAALPSWVLSYGGTLDQVSVVMKKLLPKRK